MRNVGLVVAAESGHGGEGKALLAGGADVKVKDKAGCTVLTYAAARGLTFTHDQEKSLELTNLARSNLIGQESEGLCSRITTKNS
jgi:hypothetical protein